MNKSPFNSNVRILYVNPFVIDLCCLAGSERGCHVIDPVGRSVSQITSRVGSYSLHLLRRFVSPFLLRVTASLIAAQLREHNSQTLYRLHSRTNTASWLALSTGPRASRAEAALPSARSSAPLRAAFRSRAKSAPRCVCAVCQRVFMFQQISLCCP